MSILSYRSWALWSLGYPDAALRDADDALKDAREIGQAATLMYALFHVAYHIPSAANSPREPRKPKSLWLRPKKKGSPLWKAGGIMRQGNVLALTGRASDAMDVLISGIAAFRTTGSNCFVATLFSSPWPAFMPSLGNGRRRAQYVHHPYGLIAASHVVAVEFTTVAAANNYWR